MHSNSGVWVYCIYAHVFCLPEAHIQLSAGLHGEDLGSGVDEDSTCVMSFLGCVYNLVFSSSPFFLTEVFWGEVFFLGRAGHMS